MASRQHTDRGSGPGKDVLARIGPEGVEEAPSLPQLGSRPGVQFEAVRSAHDDALSRHSSPEVQAALNEIKSRMGRSAA